MAQFDSDGDEIPDFLRAFDDTRKTRKLIYDGMLDSVKKRFPVENDEYRIELSNVRYTGPQDYSLKQIKDALLKNRKLQTPMSGTWKLVHKPTNTVLDERDDVLMHVPYYTDRGTLISNGNEYTVVNQARLRAGVYARKKKSGEYEAQFNTKPGTGPGFHIEMAPSTGVFTLTSGQAHIPLYSILKGLGVDDKTIMKSWGTDVTMANAKKHDPRAMRRLYARLAGRKAIPNLNDLDTDNFVKEALSKAELDEDVVQRTMGLEGVKSVTPALLLRASQKVLNISRGDEQEDKRDAPRFAQVYSIEDFLRERVDKDSGKLSQQLLWRAKRDRNLGRIPRGALNPYIDQFLNGTGLALPGEEASPLSNYVQMHRLTRLGQGGIGSIDLVTDEARDVQGDYLGYVDPVAGPECFVPGSFIFTNKGFIRVEDVTLDTEVACNIDGKLEFRKPERVIAEPYSGLVYEGKSDYVHYKVTPTHRLWCQKLEGNREYRFLSAAEGSKCQLGFMCGGHSAYEPEVPYTEVNIPYVTCPTNNCKSKPLPPIEIGLFCRFLGWFISEGNTDGESIDITQSLPTHLDDLKDVLQKMPIEFRYDGKRFRAGNRSLAAYLQKLGRSWEKYIPEEFFEAPAWARKLLLDSLCYGDGRHKRDTFSYCTTSKRLAEDVERLCISLGISCNMRFERDDRDIARRTHGTWVVHVNKRHMRALYTKNRHRLGNYYEEYYCGKVYCVTVPGGLVYARYGDRGAHWTGNSPSAGVDVRIAGNTYKGNDGQLYTKMLNMRTGKREYVSLAKASDHRVAFPGQDPKSPYLYAMKDNVPMRVPMDEVDYMVPSIASMETTTANLNPMPTGVQGVRQFYATKFWEQYLPMVKGEVPLVDSLMPNGKETFSEHYGKRVASVTSQEDGIVTAVDGDRITVKGADGKKHDYELVKYFPHNRMSSFSTFPSVEVGQEVKKGDLLAHSNYTDAKTGAFNMGVNLKVAIMPSGDSGNYEDAITISETAARKLATEQLFGFDADTRNGVEIDKKKYMSLFPQKFTKDQYATLDDNGVVKPGTELHRGDPIIVSVGPKLLSAKDAQLGRLSKVLRNAYTDKAEVWEHDWPGTVVDAVATSRGAKVNVVTAPPKQSGDKLSPSQALKGVIGDVRPDNEMPRDAYTNEPYEILMNPMGFLSRVAPNQLIEIALGKLAKKTGQQVRIPQLPPEEGWAVWAQRQLDAAGVKDSSDVFDPRTGKTIKGIGDGYVHIHAFHHLAEKKLSARGDDASYTQDEAPSRGGFSGAKRVSGLSRTALLSHGATENLKDMMTIRGTKNEEYWNKLRLGLPVQEPGVPFIYTKFLESLKAGGINVVEKGNKTSILPLTDKDIDAMSEGRTITSSKMVDSDLRPVAGGLFDVGKTGGPDGNRWTAIKLPEPVPNPVMEEPVRRVLGLTVEKLEGILAGTEKLDGKTGGEAIKSALEKVDVDTRIRQARSDIQNKRGAARDDAVKVLGYLKSMQEQGLEPKDWVITKVPVIPPKFRPVSKLGDVQLVSDMNDLYKDVIENAENYMALKGSVADSSLADERLNLYKSVAAAFGLGDPITPEGQAKNIKGAIRQVIGTGSPKWSMFQAKIIAKNLDNVGRGVVIPDENYDMDQLGVPEKIAWEVYKPYVQRSLVRRGYNPVQATRMIEERDKTAEQFLRDEMDRRPILMERAPAWHKFNVMAFRPKIVDGNVLRVSPLVDEPYNMDHDGDQVNIHVPSSEKAVREAYERMLPSKNLIALDDLSSPRYKLAKEQVLGLYNATQAASNKPVTTFRTVQEAKEAYRKGLIGLNDPIRILT